MGNAEVLRRVLVDGFGRGDLALADECAAPRVREHEYGAPGRLSGPELLRAQILEARSSLADMTMRVEDLVEDGDKVWARSIASGTDPRTGEPVSITVFDLCRFEDGRIVEHWGVPDRFALLHQTGAL